MVELIIEGQVANLSEDIAADITYSLADIRTPEKRQVNYSKTITLVGTAQNNYIFGNIFDVNVENAPNDPAFPNVGVNFTPKKLAKAMLIADGVQIFDGTLRLWKIVKKSDYIEYEVSLFGKLFDIFSALGDNKLTDLDFSNFNHAYTWANIKNTWVNGYNGAFVYPFIDNGYNTQDEDGKPASFRFGSLSPCLFYKVYLDKIFSSVNSQYILGFQDRTIFDKIIVTPPNTVSTSRPNFFSSILTTDVTTMLRFNLGPTTDRHIRIFDTILSNTGGFTFPTYTDFVFGPVSNAAIRFSKRLSLSMQIKFDVTIQTPSGNAGFKGDVIIDVNSYAGSTLKILNLATTTINLPAGTRSISQSVVLEIPFTNFVGLEDIQLRVTGPNGWDIIIRKGATIKAISPTDDTVYPLQSGDIYDVQQSVPLEIKQVDFIKDFIKLFNLFVTQDAVDPSIFTFTPQVDFYQTDKTNARDWTGKVDHSEIIEFTPINQLTAKQYLLTWKQDKDYWCTLYETIYQEVYGQVTYISDTDVVTNTEKIEMLFSPAVMTRFKNSAVLAPAIYKVENKDGIDIKKPDKFNSRLLIWGGLKNAGHGIGLLSTNNTVIEYIYQYPYAGHINDPINPTYDLNFSNTNTDLPTAGANTFSKYWNKVLRDSSNKDAKLISCTMYIKPGDIEALDFSALYRVDDQLYRLNKISGFNPFDPDTSKVELIKVLTL